MRLFLCTPAFSFLPSLYLANEGLQYDIVFLTKCRVLQRGCLNLLQIPFTQNPLELEKDVVKMPSGRKDVYRLLPVRSWSVRSHSGSHVGIEESTVHEEMYGSVLQPVPVIIVGSHYDLVPMQDQPTALARTQELVNEMKKR